MTILVSMKTKPSEVTLHAWIQLHRTHRYLLETVEKTLKVEGLPALDWYDVLLELHREKRDGLRQYEIGDKVLLNKHNLSRLIDRLENEQLVSRLICAEDKRANRIIITDKGEKMLKRMWPTYSKVIQATFGAKLDSDEILKLSKMLDKVLGLIE